MTAAPPQVSVILCAYDYGRYVAQAIESALAQDHPSFEVIVVDDGSTDDTAEVVARFGDAVRYVHRENGGLMAATSTGMEVACGEYLTFLDADDTWPRNRLKVLARVLDRDPAVGLVYGDMAVVDETGKVVERSFRRSAGIDVVSGHALGRLMRGNVISAGATMVRASHKPHFHPIDPVAPYQDWWIACRVAAHAEIASVDAVVNLYRRHDANMNLGQARAGQLALQRAELPFRRWLLSRAEADAQAPSDLVAALRQFDAMIGLQPDLEAILPVEVPLAQAALARASEAMDAARWEEALAALVAAAAHDPGDLVSRDLVRQLWAALAAPPKVAA